MGLTEQRYKVLREKLDNLGYRQPLALESLLLVEHLVSDLLHTKENVQHYKSLAQQSLERCGELDSGVEPFKEENGRLVQECNELRRGLNEERKSNEKLCKELKSRIRCLENNNTDLEFVCSQHLERINELSRRLAEKGQKILSLKGLKTTTSRPTASSKHVPRRTVSSSCIGAKHEKRSPVKNCPASQPYGESCISIQLPSSGVTSLSDVCSLSRKKLDSLLKELEGLKQEKLDYIEEIASVQNKVAARNREIERLHRMLEGIQTPQMPMPMLGECYCAHKECCCGTRGSCHGNGNLENQLRDQLRECQELQHEAMCRAVKLAERNVELEEELKKKKASPCDCHKQATRQDATAKEDGKTIRKLQEQLDCRLLEVEELGARVKELEKAKKDLETDKGSVDHVLENVVEERKKLSDRVNQLSIIENDLMNEIDRLSNVNKQQHARLVDLESRLLIAEKKLNTQSEKSKLTKPVGINGTGPSDGATSSGQLIRKLPQTKKPYGTRILKSMPEDLKSVKPGISKMMKMQAQKEDNGVKLPKDRRLKEKVPPVIDDAKDESSKDEASRSSRDESSPSGSSDHIAHKILTKGRQRDINKQKEVKEKQDECKCKRRGSCEVSEEKLRKERAMLDEERKKFEETIRNLTDKQTELINKLDEASASAMGAVGGAGAAGQESNTAQVGTSSGPSERELLEKLERLQAERDYYYKEFSRLREQVSSLAGVSVSDPGSRVQSPLNVLERIVNERNFYQKEFCRLQEQLSSGTVVVPAEKPEAGELKARLNEKEQEVLALKEKLQFLNHNRGDNTAQNGVIMRLEMERDAARGDCARLEEDRNAIKERLKSLTEKNKEELDRLEESRQQLETTVTRLDMERREMLNNLGSSKAKIKMLEDKLEDYRDQIRTQQNEQSQQRSHLNHIKLLQDQTDRALSTSQDMLTQTEAELASALERIHELEQNRLSLEREVSALRNERGVLKSNLSQLDEEKDKLLLKVDEKTEQVVRLERELKQRDSRIMQLEDVLADMQRKLDCALDNAGHTEQNSRHLSKEMDRLRQEMLSLEHSKENAMRENKRLQDDLAAMTHDHINSARALEASKRDVEDLKMQLQGYVTEVRHIEDILEQKESERTDMLDQFRNLTMEATALESNNHTLESEAKSTKSMLHAAEQEINDLQRKLQDKDSLIHSYEKQMSELTANIAGLEMQLAKQAEQKQRIENDLMTARELCCKLDKQKETLAQQATENEMTKLKLEKDYCRIQAKHNDLEEELEQERRNSATLENVLAASRQETLEKKMSNNELREQVEMLHKKVSELQKKLEHGNEALRQCQTESAEYHHQISELRREVTNERFERARAEERSVDSISSTSPT